MKFFDSGFKRGALRIGVALGALVIVALFVQKQFFAERSASAETWDLSARPTPGLRAVLVVEETGNTQARHGAIKAKPREFAREFELLVEVALADDPTKNPLCQATIQRLAERDEHPLHELNFTGELGRKSEDASEEPEDGDHHLDHRVSQLRALLGASCVLELSPDSSAPAAMGAPAAAAILEQIFAERPPHPVAMKEEWSSVRITQIPGIGAVEVSTTSAFKEIRERGLHRYAEIDVTVSGRPLPVEDGAEPYQLEELSGKGARSINVDTGMLARESIETKVILVSEGTRLTCTSASSISVHNLR